MTVKQAIQLFIADCQYRNLSQKTLRYYQQQLGILAGYVGDQDATNVTFKAVKQILMTESTERKWSAGTTNHMITAVRRLFAFLFEEELLDEPNG